MHKQSLDANWTLRAVNDLSQIPPQIRDRAFAAWTPSCVHTVLLKHGVIEDPYLKDNESKLHWIGESDWEYRCTFDADGRLFDHERIDFCFDGLDTIATVYLNEVEIGRGENMHLAYRFDARRALRHGRNELSIIFHSPLNYARHWEKTLGPLPRSNGDGGPFNFIRKMACNFGWDWGPVCVTSGVWKEVRVEGWSHARFLSVRPDDKWKFWHSDRNVKSVDIPFEIEFTSPSARDSFDLSFELTSPNIPIGSGRKELSDFRSASGDYLLQVAPRLPQEWNPRGYGSPSLYTIRLSLLRNDLPVDAIQTRFGLRTISLTTAPDDIGREFVIKVNGRPIFAKGFNWIPDDCFLDRATKRERYRTRIQQAIDCGCNMLRVWGGGIYETDDFYDICDELGVMVWQDFPFACAMYPEEEPFKSLVEAEAKQNVIRLSSHPSLVLWNGCNENLIAYRGWGNPTWSKQVKGRTWGKGYYFDVLAKVMAENDPSRPYWPASPYSGDPDCDAGVDPNSQHHGNMHLWEVWHGQGDYTNYREFIPRFCSEFGYQAPANYATMAEALGEENLVRGNKLLEVHQKSPGGNERNERLLAKDFDLEKLDYKELHYLLQLNQARALTTGVEWFRANWPRCTGTLIWQLNDCYPVTSWSAIDSAGRKKLLWYATRKFHAERLITIHPREGVLVAHLVNDTDDVWNGECDIFVQRFVNENHAPDRLRLRSENKEISVAPRSVEQITLGSLDALKFDPTHSCIVVKVGDHRAFWFGTSDKNIAYPRPKVDLSIERAGDVHRVTLRANLLVRDLCFLIDHLDPDATVCEQMLTMLPGETATIEIESKLELTPQMLLSPPVFRTANEFGAD